MANVTKLTTKTSPSGAPLIHADADDGKSFEWTVVEVTPPTPPTVPSTPSNLRASYNMQRQGVDLTWDVSPGATSYPIKKSIPPATSTSIGPATTNSYFDPVPQGSADVTIRYAVAAQNSAGTSAYTQDAMVTVPGNTTPPPQHGPDMVPPSNLRAIGVQSGGGVWTDNLLWDSGTNYPSYNIYCEDAKIGSSQSKSFTVPKFYPMAYYTVCGVDSMGMESRPSSPALAMGHGSRGGSAATPTPSNLVATGEWNNGRGRITLTWRAGAFYGHTYNIYRDGTRIADNIPIQFYADEGVSGSHSYQVTTNGGTIDAGNESARSNTATATAPTAAPAGGKPVTIQQIIPNNNSAKVVITPVPGAVDYRCYLQGHPDHCKYAGAGGNQIEMNGLDPAVGNFMLVAEALDKLGPFMRMDGTSNASDPWISKARHPMDPAMPTHINGQGDASNSPNTIGTSAPFSVTLKPKSLTGNPKFLDTFDNNQPLVQSGSIDPRVYNRHSWTGKPNNTSNPYLKEFTNNNWRIREYWNNAQAVRIFFMNRHLMDTLYDGGVVGPNPEGDSSPPHNANASDTFEPMVNGQPVAFDIGGGKVLHITMEVDGFFNPRRWCDIGFLPAGDALCDPAIEKLDFSKKMAPTQTGEALVWEIMSALVSCKHFCGDGTNTGHYARLEDAIDQSYPGDHTGPAARDQGNPSRNGGPYKLDRRSTFDLYCDGSRLVIVEDGVKLKDTTLKTPFAGNKVNVWYSHHLYHDVNDVSENARNDLDYWYNFRQDADERHWNFMGAESLPSWPTIP